MSEARQDGCKLAIIVPAYKAPFLREALESIGRQTDRNFNLYVFDDGSPEPVEAIAREFAERMPLQFHRFPENMGRRSIAKHWERCMRMTREPWVWLFSDDDLMEPGCVADFFAELERTGAAYDGYRFDNDTIDAAGKTIRLGPSHQEAEQTGTTFLMNRWSDKRTNTLQELVFSRRAWEAFGGIPEYPLGWHSDDALSVLLSGRRPVRRISGSGVHTRLSTVNLSMAGSLILIMRAASMFMPWAVAFIREHDPARVAEARRLSERWLFKILYSNLSFLWLQNTLALERLSREAWGHWPGWGLLVSVGFNLKMFWIKSQRALQRLSSKVGGQVSPQNS